MSVYGPKKNCEWDCYEQQILCKMWHLQLLLIAHTYIFILIVFSPCSLSHNTCFQSLPCILIIQAQRTFKIISIKATIYSQLKEDSTSKQQRVCLEGEYLIKFVNLVLYFYWFVSANINPKSRLVKCY